MTDLEVALLDDFALPSAKGGRRPQDEISATVVRALTPADIPALLGSSGAETREVQPVRKLAHAHHQLAQLLAKGASQSEAALLTGYSPAYVCNLAGHDPAFRELVEAYRGEREALWVDALERMKVLGLTALDEIQARLADDPAQFSNRELAELAETLLVKGARSPGGGGGVGGQAAGLAISIKFVGARPMLDVSPGAEGK